MLSIYSICGNQKGIAFPVALAFLAILGLLGSTAVVTTTTDMKIGGNYKVSEQAFYVAQAGLEEGRARFKADAANPINDGHPTQTQWTAYIGSDAKAQGKGYDSGNTMHYKTNSLQSDLDYTVQITHQTDGAGTTVLLWGDDNGDGIPERNINTGENIYLVTSYGCAGGTEKTVEVEITRLPPITVPAALYVQATTTIMGSSTTVIGTDACGGADKPGIVTTLGAGSITENGGPTITGSPSNISYNGTNMDIQSIVDAFKGDANFSYTVDSATQTGTTTPGPGDDWGTPTPGASDSAPSSCGETNIVYYDTGGTHVKFSGGVSGCGILIVEGDLEVSGGFWWHGLVITTGSFKFTGGGSDNKNITGGLLSGGSVDADVVGGKANIVYCSTAITSQTQNKALRILTWNQEM